MEQNKTGKYFKYAIGEIVLVVIGILIALQINNLNEHRKTQNKQEEYLHLLKKESLTNLTSIKMSKDFIEFSLKEQNELVKLIDAKQDTISEKRLSKLLWNIFIYTNRFAYQNSVLAELKTSGEFKNMQNDSLRNDLINLEPVIKVVQGQEQAIIDVFNEFDQILNKYGDRRKIFDDKEISKLVYSNKAIKSTGNIVLLEKKEFENLLMQYSSLCYNLVYQYQSLETYFTDLLIMYDKEIKKRK